MRIGIVSDTHGHDQYTLDAVRMLECLEVERVIHSIAYVETASGASEGLLGEIVAIH